VQRLCVLELIKERLCSGGITAVAPHFSYARSLFGNKKFSLGDVPLRHFEMLKQNASIH
jgi:hypothetical protein